MVFFPATPLSKSANIEIVYYTLANADFYEYTEITINAGVHLPHGVKILGKSEASQQKGLLKAAFSCKGIQRCFNVLREVHPNAGGD
jgi:hypothetical protein